MLLILYTSKEIIMVSNKAFVPRNRHSHWLRPRRFLSAVAVVAAATNLFGCAVSGPRESALPQNGPTMVDIYRHHMAGDAAGEIGSQQLPEHLSGGSRTRLPLREPGDPSPNDLQRASMTGIENRFARLPNPDLVMYVMPHLANGHYPVPGYVTVFPMYEKVEYALPGEVGSHHTAGR